MPISGLNLGFFLLIICTTLRSVPAETNNTDIESEVEDDYFYDAQLSESEIEKIQVQKKKEKELAASQNIKETVTPPPFVVNPEKKADQDLDLNKYYMEEMVKMVMKK